MKTSSLELLEKTQLPPAQARAILQVMESEFAIHGSALVSRADLREAFHDLDLKIEVLRGETRTEIQTLRTEMQTLGGELRTEIQTLRAEMIREIRGLTRWSFVFWATQFAAIIGVLKLAK
jgi:hypothetical protein